MTLFENLMTFTEADSNGRPLTKEEIGKLRKEIVLNSLYTKDYENSFGIDPHKVQDFFDSFVEYICQDVIEGFEDDEKTSVLDAEFKKYDNAEEIYDYYAYVFDTPPFTISDNAESLEEARQLSPSEFKRFKAVLNKHNPLKNIFVLHTGSPARNSDDYTLRLPIYGAFKEYESKNDYRGTAAANDGIGCQLFYININLLDSSIEIDDKWVDTYYLSQYINRVKNNSQDSAMKDIDADVILNNIKTAVEQAKPELEKLVANKSFTYNLTGKAKKGKADDYDLNLGESLLKEAYSKDIPNEILDMIKNSSRVRDAFIKIGLDPSKMIIDKVDKLHKHNPNYIPIEIYEYDLKDGYSSSAHSSHGGTGISIGNIDINRNTGHYFTPGIYISKTGVIGMYEIDITKNIENDAIIGDKIELRAINKNDSKNQYLDRNKPDDVLTDKSGYYTSGNFKSEYGKKWLKQRRDVMQKSVTSTNESLLKEDFDPSMPNWLMRAIKLLNINRSYGRHKDFIFDISLDTAKWTVDKLPDKGTFATVTKNKIFALLLNAYGADSDKKKYIVYSPGLNLGYDETIMINNRERRINAMSLKALAPYVVEYAYIPDADLEYSKVKDKRKDRANAKSGSVDRVNRAEYDRLYWDGDKFDKSGYIVDPDKYTTKLAAIKSDNYVQRAQDLYTVLTDLYDKVINQPRNNVPKPDTSKYVSPFGEHPERFSKIYKYYTTAVGNYQEAMKAIQAIKDEKAVSTWSTKPAFKDFDNNIADAEKAIASAYNLLK